MCSGAGRVPLESDFPSLSLSRRWEKCVEGVRELREELEASCPAGARQRWRVSGRLRIPLCRPFSDKASRANGLGLRALLVLKQLPELQQPGFEVEPTCSPGGKPSGNAAVRSLRASPLQLQAFAPGPSV